MTDDAAREAARATASATARRFFDDLWRDGDPWGLDVAPLDQRRYDRQVELLAGRSYAGALEVGCAAGSFTERLAPLCSRVLALDIASSAVERARERALPGVDFRVADVMETDVAADGPWDLVVLTETVYYLGWLHPLFDVAWLVHELFAATTPGGRLLLVDSVSHEHGIMSRHLLLTYRDLVANVGFVRTVDEVMVGTKDGVEFVDPADPVREACRMTLSVVVSGMVAGTLAQGGASWAVLQYLTGLAGSGTASTSSSRWPAATSSGRPPRATPATSCGRSALDGRWCLLGSDGSTAGLSYAHVMGVADEADLLLNVSGMLTDAALLDRIPVRAYLDLDPGFIQLWHAVEGIDMRFGAHNRFVTIGHALGSAGSAIPDCGLDWVTTHQPVVLEHWPRATEPPSRGFTTVGNWRGYGSVEHEGVHYGQKVHSLRPLFPLPQRTSVPLDVALAIDPAETSDLDALHQHGWHLVDAAEVTRTPDTYREFVRSSTAELGVAKSGTWRRGWGGSATGASATWRPGGPSSRRTPGSGPTCLSARGCGRSPTSTPPPPASRRSMSDYVRHSDAARAIAADVFDSDRVLPALLERLA
jgi:SAM-dependent methyltransferase